jgi:putative ABC transport system permease protein
VNQLPLAGSNVNGNIDIEGRTFPRDSRPVVDKCVASADYFSTLRIPLVQGRFFREQDAADAPHVAIINQAFARRYFPNENPIGKRVGFNWEIQGLQEIVGVIGDVKHDGLADPVRAELYVPYSQRPDQDFQIVMRTKTDPASLVSEARAAVLAVDQSQPINSVETMDAIVSHSLTDQRTAMWLLAAFAGLALVLTAVGIYGVISYSVSQRTREIGLRMALGAQRGDVMQHVVREGMALVLWGVGIGLAVGLAVTRVLASQIYGVSPRDPLTFAAVAALLAGVALGACYVPARRATLVDPTVALRCE